MMSGQLIIWIWYMLIGMNCTCITDPTDTGDCTILATKSKIGNLPYLPYKGVTAT